MQAGGQEFESLHLHFGSGKVGFRKTYLENYIQRKISRHPRCRKQLGARRTRKRFKEHQAVIDIEENQETSYRICVTLYAYAG